MKDLEFYEHSIDTLIEVERLDDARRELNAAYQLFPEETSLKYIDAKIYFLADDFVSALRSIHSALTDDPDDANFRFLHCKILVGLGRQKEAILVLEDLIKDFPDDAENYSYYAAILFELKKYKKSRQLAEKALQIDPDELSAKLTLPLLDIVSGKLKATDKAIQELLAEHPESEAVAWILGLQLYSKFRYASAMNVFQELLRKSPHDPDIVDMIVELKVLMHPLCRPFLLLAHSELKLTLIVACIMTGLTKTLFRVGYPQLGTAFGFFSFAWLSLSLLIPALLKRKFQKRFT